MENQTEKPKYEYVGGTPADDHQGRRLRTNNAVWTLGPGKWALGAYKICQQITDTIPEDQEAVWEDADHNRFCIRPQPVTPAQFDENALVAPRFSYQPTGLYEIGRGIIVKFRHMGFGGSSREPAAMKLVRKEAPSVPVPEVFHHWKDPTWFCYVTIMQEAPGHDIAGLWYALEESQKQRLAEEVAEHMRVLAEIQSDVAVYANGDNLCDNTIVPFNYLMWADEWAEPERIPHRFNFKELNELRKRFRKRPMPEEYGDRFHFCHMDIDSFHVRVSDGVTKLPDGIVHSMPLEEQAKLHVCAFVNWVKAGFFPKFMVSYPFLFAEGSSLPYRQCGQSPLTGGEFHRAVMRALTKLGFPDPRIIDGFWCIS